MYDRANTRTVLYTATLVLNPALIMDVYTPFLVLCCPEYVQDLRLAGLSSESYQASKGFTIS